MRRLVSVVALLVLLFCAAGPTFGQGGETVYIVQPGDTLFSIAQRYQVPLATLAQVNGITDPSRIYAGQRLIIPTGTITTTTTTTTTTVTTTITTVPTTTAPTTTTQVHVVQPGENLYRISLRYGVDMMALAAINGISDPGQIYVGQQLIIPASGTVVSAPITVVNPVVPSIPVAASGGTVFTLNGRQIAAGSLPRPNNSLDLGTFETNRENFRQIIVSGRSNLVALTISDIRYGPYWATMRLSLTNLGVSPALVGGRTTPGTTTVNGIVGYVTGPSSVPIPRVTGPWGFNVTLTNGRVVQAFAGCRHISTLGGASTAGFDCGSEYLVNPADVPVGGSATSELVVYFANPWTILDPNQLGTGNHISAMSLFGYTPDGRQTGSLIQISMP